MSTPKNFQNALRGTTPVLLPYTLKTANFTAEAGKAYAVAFKPEVMPQAELLGLRLTGTGSNLTTAIQFYYNSEGDSEQINWDASETDNNSEIYFGTFVTLDLMIQWINANSTRYTASLLVEGTGTDVLTASGGADLGDSVAGAAASGITVTLPTPTEGQVFDFADTNGTWGDYPITITANRLIEGQEVNFVNNAAGTFFRVLFVGGDTGLRILTSGTKPLNLTAPTITGTYLFTATSGTWTGSPSSYAYQWQLSDNGETGWANIADATTSSYVPVEDDDTKFLRCGVIATNANGPSARFFTLPTAAIEVPDFPVAGLLAFWKLNDNGSGGLDVTDASGNGHTLTNNLSVLLGTGQVAGAAEFDGDNSLTVDLSTSPVANATTFSIAGWVNSSAFINDRAFLQAYDGGANGWSFLSIANDEVGLSNANSWEEGIGEAIAEDTWFHHATVVTDGVAKLYINGVLKLTAEPSVKFGVSCPFTMGYNSPHASVPHLQDNVGIWTRPITEPEVALLAAGATL